MIFEIGSAIVMAGVAGFSYFKTNGPAINDAEKIQKIFTNSGWIGRNGETIRIHRKSKINNGTEYVFQLPLGFDRKRIESDKHVIEDGLNVRQTIPAFDPRELLTIKWDRTAIDQIKEILKKKRSKRKEIDISFDGMLKIRVYDSPMPSELGWDDSFIKYDGWLIPVGQSRNEIVYHDFEDRSHMIVAGATGFGKSQFLKMLITVLVMIQPEHVQFSLIDLKGGTAFQRFQNLKQVRNYSTEPKGALEVLQAVQNQMNDDLSKIVSGGYEDVKEARIRDRHFIIIDEAADIAQNEKCMDIVTDIARRGRGAGYRLIYATQYPTNQTLPSQVRQNIGARVCFILETNAASRAVLDEGGAEDLPEIPGRAIYRRVKNTIIQAPCMKNKDIETKIGPHIVIKPRKDEKNGQPKDDGKGTTRGKHSFEFEKV